MQSRLAAVSGRDFIRRFYQRTGRDANYHFADNILTNQKLLDPQSLAAKLQLHVQGSRELGQVLPSCTIDRRDSRQRVTTAGRRYLAPYNFAKIPG